MSKTKDPVCEMEIDAGSAAETRTYEGQTFHFCSAECARHFDSDPATYASHSPSEIRDRSQSHAKHAHAADQPTPSPPADRPTENAYAERHAPDGKRRSVNRERQTVNGAWRTATASYTCPMHPEIEQDHPGQCPKCGMTLEPKTIGGVDDEEQREIRSLSIKFWVGLVLTIPVFLLSMGKYIPGLHLDSLIPVAFSKWLELILVAGVPGISDPIKATTPGAIKALHELGLKVIMATGDNQKTADAVARELAIDEVRAELNPKEFC